MIFVTVGTHEQGFDRLIKAIDEQVRDGEIVESVTMQIGYSTYKPRYCKFKQFMSYDEMRQYVKQADIVITHGGPASFIDVLNANKIPIVAPRLKEYGEHVNLDYS
ncbi:glycosyltransferase [Lacticaseibacillus hegangensis]|uniref:Glycosyltransferase n=1 Tax=Lacticaseibacillus hegangensis TaxID=2486010 RepID=A0ABW4CUH8_9LACO|nr:glycosyltransferase [Lacticaseibacillus hegangensis]